jgi:hypothetical protein
MHIIALDYSFPSFRMNLNLAYYFTSTYCLAVMIVTGSFVDIIEVGIIIETYFIAFMLVH